MDGRPEEARADLDAILRGEEAPSAIRAREEEAAREREEWEANQRRAWAVARAGQVG